MCYLDTGKTFKNKTIQKPICKAYDYELVLKLLLKNGLVLEVLETEFPSTYGISFSLRVCFLRTCSTNEMGI